MAPATMRTLNQSPLQVSKDLFLLDNFYRCIGIEGNINNRYPIKLIYKYILVGVGLVFSSI